MTRSGRKTTPSVTPGTAMRRRVRSRAKRVCHRSQPCRHCAREPRSGHRHEGQARPATGHLQRTKAPRSSRLARADARSRPEKAANPPPLSDAMQSRTSQLSRRIRAASSGSVARPPRQHAASGAVADTTAPSVGKVTPDSSSARSNGVVTRTRGAGISSSVAATSAGTRVCAMNSRSSYERQQHRKLHAIHGPGGTVPTIDGTKVSRPPPKPKAFRSRPELRCVEATRLRHDLRVRPSPPSSTRRVTDNDDAIRWNIRKFTLQTSHGSISVDNGVVQHVCPRVLLQYLGYNCRRA